MYDRRGTMAKFDGLQGKASANSDAWIILADVRNTFQALAKVKGWLDKYGAADPSDPFRVAVNAFYTTAERSDLGAIANLMATLHATLAADYPEAVGS